MKTVRLAGAQIPINDYDIQFNKKEILKAIDWAKENEVDELLTPECALSGYGPAWAKKIPELNDALKEVEDHQKKCRVGLHLGTQILNNESSGSIKRNQIRHYTREGMIYSCTNKTYVIAADGDCLPSFNPTMPFTLPFSTEDKKYLAVGMVCNDMWGCVQEQGVDFKPTKSLNEILTSQNADIIFHATNGYKISEGIATEKDLIIRDTFDMFHEGFLRMTAFRSVATILTVDCCTAWDWQPSYEDGGPNGDGPDELMESHKTATPSGVIDQLGRWVVQAPRYGRQYFHYDLPLDNKEKYHKLINNGLSIMDLFNHGQE
tara:strand:+ start:1067 stop:2023 length:957 start_codon:yes stop_codon:yes gene_type:complete